MLNNYQANALRTANHTADKTMRLAVAGMGLAGEAAEVLDLVYRKDKEPIQRDVLIKELGDCAWYIAETASVVGITLESIEMPPLENDLTERDVFLGYAIELSAHAGQTTDYLKKVVGHNHQIDVDRVRSGLGLVLRAVSMLAEKAGTSLQTVCDRNTAKLKLRYPEGFSSEKSVHRTV